MVAAILENLSQSTIGRGLFHEAAVNIFSILIVYWKRFEKFNKINYYSRVANVELHQCTYHSQSENTSRTFQ